MQCHEALLQLHYGIMTLVHLRKCGARRGGLRPAPCRCERTAEDALGKLGRRVTGEASQLLLVGRVTHNGGVAARHHGGVVVLKHGAEVAKLAHGIPKFYFKPARERAAHALRRAAGAAAGARARRLRGERFHLALDTRRGSRRGSNLGTHLRAQGLDHLRPRGLHIGHVRGAQLLQRAMDACNARVDFLGSGIQPALFVVGGILVSACSAARQTRQRQESSTAPRHMRRSRRLRTRGHGAELHVSRSTRANRIVGGITTTRRR